MTSTKILRVILDIVLVINLIILILLPLLLTAIYDNTDLLTSLDRHAWESAPDITAQYQRPQDLPYESYPFYLGLLYACGLLTAWILAEGHLILRRIEKGLPFSARQPASFTRVGLAFMLLAMAFAVKIFCYNTLLTMFCCALFAVLALIGLVLRDLFAKAYQVKLENDLTI